MAFYPHLDDWFSASVTIILFFGLTALLLIEGYLMIAIAFIVLDLCLCVAWWIVFRNDFFEWRKNHFNRD